MSTNRNPQREVHVSEISVLILDSKRIDAYLIGKMLAESCQPPFRVEYAASLEEGLNLLGDTCFDLILMDPVFPGMKCRTTVKSVVERATSAPVVVVTTRGDQDLARESLRVGAQDYLVMGEIHPGLLLRTILHAIERHEMVRRLEDARRQAEHDASHDALTGLPTKPLLADRARQAIAFAHREHRGVGIIFIDLDGFKKINDLYGHDTGDSLLSAFADRLQGSVRDCDTVARIGGDEFLVLAVGLVNMQDAAGIADMLVKTLSEPYEIDGLVLDVTLSAGVAAFPGHGTDAATLIAKADHAMYQAKSAGRNAYHVYSSGKEVYLPRKRPARRARAGKPVRAGSLLPG